MSNEEMSGIGYIMLTPKGDLMLNSVRSTDEKCRQDFCETHNFNGYLDLMRLGFKSQRVEITPKERPSVAARYVKEVKALEAAKEMLDDN